MRKTTFIVAIVIVALGVVCSLWYRSSTRQQPPAAASTSGTNQSPDAVSTGAPVIPGTSLPATRKDKSKEDFMSDALATLNQVPIVFYGKVIDQDGNLVIGAKVKGGVMVEKVWMGGKNEDHYTTTDSEGTFSFSGINGRDIAIWLSKTGYQFRSDNKSFIYSYMWPEKERHKPDPNSPVVFTMWKLKGPEDLTKIRIHDYIPCDGTAVVYDMQHSRRVAGGGDLIAKLIRNPVTGFRGKRFNWRLTLEIPKGGVIKKNGVYSNEAPAEGYERTVEIDEPSDAKDWSDAITRSFYLKSAEFYGRVTVHISAGFDPPPTAFDVDGYINPKAGSRNLEQD